MKRTLVVVALVLSGAAFTSSGAIAGDARPQLDVPYSDLNLTNPFGAKVMLRRIAKAAEFVCGGQPSVREFSERSSFRRCVKGAVAGAVAQLNAPLVTALHEGRDVTDPRFAEARPYENR